MGDDVALLVDGNNGYNARPMAAADFALATAGENLYAMEEMFDEEMAPEVRELKYRLRAAGLATKLADGETHRRGIPPRLLAERVAGPGGSEEPLFDIDQPDMYANGFVRMTAIAQACAGLERLERPLPASWRSSKKRSEHSESRASLSERHSVWWEQVEPTWGSRSWPR